jgi:hypothetical protein
MGKARKPPYLAVREGDHGGRLRGKKSSPHPRGRASAAGSVSGPWSGHSATGEMRRKLSSARGPGAAAPARCRADRASGGCRGSGRTVTRSAPPRRAKGSRRAGQGHAPGTTALDLPIHERASGTIQRVRHPEFADLPKTIRGKIRRVELRAGARSPADFWEDEFPRAALKYQDYAASPAASRRPDRNRSLCSRLRTTDRGGTTIGVIARSRRTTSRASSSFPDVKQMGERSAGNPHAAFDVEGAGNVARSKLFGLNRRASPRPYL